MCDHQGSRVVDQRMRNRQMEVLESWIDYKRLLQSWRLNDLFNWHDDFFEPDPDNSIYPPNSTLTHEEAVKLGDFSRLVDKASKDWVDGTDEAFRASPWLPRIAAEARSLLDLMLIRGRFDEEVPQYPRPILTKRIGP